MFFNETKKKRFIRRNSVKLESSQLNGGRTPPLETTSLVQ